MAGLASFASEFAGSGDTMELTKEEARKLSLEDLCRVGRFNLRILAIELGMFGTEAIKAEFYSMNNEDQAFNVHVMLHREEHALLAEMKAAVEDQAHEFRQLAADVHAAHMYYRRAPTKFKRKRSTK